MYSIVYIVRNIRERVTYRIRLDDSQYDGLLTTPKTEKKTDFRLKVSEKLCESAMFECLSALAHRRHRHALLLKQFSDLFMVLDQKHLQSDLRTTAVIVMLSIGSVYVCVTGNLISVSAQEI